MRNTNYLDLSPWRRSTVGFDRLFDLMNDVNVDADGFPPFDIQKEGEDHYVITLSVAGFRPEEIELVAHQNVLTISGKKTEERNQSDQTYIHKGIATRSFERRFQLADFVEVENANLDQGLLTVHLKREVPEEAKPRKIPLTGQQERLSDQQKAPAAEEQKAAERETATV
jgi:molecular chaperone IbpA